MIQAAEIVTELIKRSVLTFTVWKHSHSPAIPLYLPLMILNGVHEGTLQCQ